MYVGDLLSFATGVLAGVVGFGLAMAFTVALLTFAGADSDRRGLSGRHRPGSPQASELPGHPSATLPVLAPQKRKRHRPESPSGVLPPT